MVGHGLTQTELARRLDVRDATVSDWFNRGTLPSGSVMLRLPTVLGVDGHWLLTGASRDSAPIPAQLSEEERVRLEAMLDSALRIVRNAGDGGGYLRVREAGQGEKLALEAIDLHRRSGRQRAGRSGS
jgi:transcriptional regulator with XRE-family HTH domain